MLYPFFRGDGFFNIYYTKKLSKMTNKKNVNKSSVTPVKKITVNTKKTRQPKPKKAPVVKTQEIDKSSFKDTTVNIVLPVEQSEIKTIISESPKVEVYLNTQVSETHEVLEPVKVSEVVLQKQSEISSECCQVKVEKTDDCSCANNIGYSIDIKKPKVSLLTRILNKIKSIF